jgi:hypothetical protein
MFRQQPGGSRKLPDATQALSFIAVTTVFKFKKQDELIVLCI